MVRSSLAVLVLDVALWSQARPDFREFEVAAVKATPADWNGGRFMRMQGVRQFVARNQSLKNLLAAAYNLNPQAISGGPDWVDSAHWDIVARTPGEVKPKIEEQMSMLRQLLNERFDVAFHRQSKVMPIYILGIGKGGSKLKESTAAPDADPALTNVVYPDRVRLPARNATMAEFVWMLQRAVLSRPVVDQTGLAGRFDFELEWTSDETQFGGELPQRESGESAKPGLYAAMQQQLGLKLEASRGPVDTLVLDRAARPTAN